MSYIAAELRRRRARTLATIGGLALGVALAVAVGSLSAGLDRASDRVLEPLRGLGGDLSVSRPVDLSGEGGPLSAFQNLPRAERRELQEENRSVRVGFADIGSPGESFDETAFITTDLSFPADATRRIESLPEVEAAGAQLSLDAIRVRGTVPPGYDRPGGPPPTAIPRDIRFDQARVTGIDLSSPELAPVTPGQIEDGEYLSGGRGEVLVGRSFAAGNGIAAGDRTRLGDRSFRVAGIAAPPLGGASADIYIELGELQRIADKRGRINTINVRLASGAGVTATARKIEREVDGAEATTAADLAERVGGSLSDARELSDGIGVLLVIAGLIAAAGLAAMLTLSSVNKRVREIGTLKAIGWPNRLVVRQIAGEAFVQGVAGALLGILLGVLAAIVLASFGPTLEASVEADAGVEFSGVNFGGGGVEAGTEPVELDAVVEPPLLAAAAGLAVLGGLIAGAAGGWRAARLRPAEALRSIE